MPSSFLYIWTSLIMLVFSVGCTERNIQMGSLGLSLKFPIANPDSDISEKLLVRVLMLDCHVQFQKLES